MNKEKASCNTAGGNIRSLVRASSSFSDGAHIFASQGVYHGKFTAHKALYSSNNLPEQT